MAVHTIFIDYHIPTVTPEWGHCCKVDKTKQDFSQRCINLICEMKSQLYITIAPNSILQAMPSLGTNTPKSIKLSHTIKIIANLDSTSSADL